MKLAKYKNAAYLIKEEAGKPLVGMNITKSSNGLFGCVKAIVERWDEFMLWYNNFITKGELCIFEQVAQEKLEAPILMPRQIFAIGMNYINHAKEVGLDLPTTPSVFTKFSSAIAPPYCEVKIPGEATDWEVELVVVIKHPLINGVAQKGRRIEKKDAHKFIAGYMIGQDISERLVQFACNPAQFSLAKSYENFAPIGPWLTTSDEIENPNALKIESYKNGESVQSSNTDNMVFDIPELIHRLSQAVELLPGDLIFTGTPEGVGQGRKPPVYLQKGDVVVSKIEGLGELKQTFV